MKTEPEDHQHLRTRLACWLKRQGLELILLIKGEIYFDLTDGRYAWQCRIRCEEQPLILHIISRIPGRVPASEVTETAFRLHEVNRSMRFGFFTFFPEKRTISHRLTRVITAGPAMEAQFDEALGQAHQVMTTSAHALWQRLEQPNNVYTSSGSD